MSIWFVVWLLLSLGLIYFMVWTSFILFRQKQVWQAFAKANKMRYRSDGFLESPEVSGEYEGYNISMFIGEHGDENARGSRKLTAIEIKFKDPMPFDGVCASGDMVRVAEGLNFAFEWSPDSENWKDERIITGESRIALEQYFNAERLEALNTLMIQKGLWVIFVFKEDTVLLRIDTPNPLGDAKKLKTLLAKMIKVAKVLELKSGEGKKIKSDILNRPEKEVSLEIEESDQSSGLELEEGES